MKRIIAALAAFSLSATMLFGCAGGIQGQAPNENPPAEKAEAIEIVCATFPAYDWARQVIAGQEERYEVTYLMGSGVDLHSYQPTVQDIDAISSCDLFVYVGGESDAWAEEALEAAENPAVRSVSMLEAVGDAAVEEELVAGMQETAHARDHEGEQEGHEEHAEGGSHEGEEAHDHGEEGPEYDEHVWLSLENAQVVVDAIAGELSIIDPEHKTAYEENASAYNGKLAALDARYADAAEAGRLHALVFADRFPFRYLADDYGLDYFAAFSGCSAETEASFNTISFLAQKVDELGADSVIVIENSDRKIADAVVAATKSKGQQIVVMDSLQSVTKADAEGGKTYLGTMEDNLASLAAALG